MSNKRRIRSGVTALALAGGVVLGVVPAAHAATVACGSACMSPYSQYLGTSQVLAVGTQKALPSPGCVSDPCGDVVMLAPASDSNPAEDFAASDEGTVQQFATAGLLSMNLTVHYATDQVFEFQYAPNGASSGLCVGFNGQDGSGVVIALKPCGKNNKTLFIVDAANASNGYSDLISGTTTTFASPLVLTVGTGAGHALSLASLSQSGTTVADTQMWANEFGVLP